MSAREWKPGDVALIRVPAKSAPGHAITAPGYADVPVFHSIDGGWIALSSPDYFWAHDYSFHNVPPRPVVVIDPEDREQTARLADLFCEARWCHVKGGDTDECDPLTRSAMREALAAYANPTPPRPEEPTGLGAVVEDAAGVRWVRIERGAAEHDGIRLWISERDEDARPLPWSSIAAVRVLAEGVTA